MPTVKYCPLCGKEYDDDALVCPGDGATLVRSRQETDPLIGQVLKGSYRIEEQIGAGGMGAVFRAVQMPLGRPVAVKVLLPAADSAPSMISRFFQEAKLLSQLSHPNVVGIIDFGNTESGMIFMVMEHLSGKTLGEHVPPEGLPPAEAAHWMRQACAGVGAAHRCSLVHRDLKPENLFLATSLSAPETLKVLDFGIARTVEEQDQTRLTRAGLLMGTPGFIAPEQIENPADADARSDVYALGAILFFMVTGRRPYEGLTPHSILVKQMQKPPSLDLGLLAEQPELAAVIGKAMERDPAARYESTDELAAALDEAVGHAEGAGPGRPAVPATGPGTAAAGTRRDRRSLAGEAFPRTVLMDDQAPPPRGRARRLLTAVAALLVAAMLAAGWAWWRARGDGGADRASSSTAGGGAAGDAGGTVASTARGVTADRITIGMSAAFSGPARELGRGMQTGIETCFRDLNEDGGVHGRTLHLVALDDGYEPSRTVANMIELLLERKVFAVLGNVGTPTAEVAVPLALEHRVPFVGAFSGAELLRREPPDRYVFNYRASYDQETAAIVGHLLDRRGLEPSQIAVFAQEDGFGDAGFRGVVRTLERRGHAGPVLRVGYRRNSIEVEGAVETLARRGAEIRGVVMVATYRAAAEFIRRVADAGLDPVFANLSFVGSRALAEELSELGPRYAEGVIVTQVVPHFESAEPGVARYRESLARHFPAEQPGFVSLEGYLAARVFAEALLRAGGEPSVEGFVDAIQGIDRLDLGIGAELGFGDARHQASNRVWGTVLDGSGSYRSLEL